ncbi:high mobility group box domain-containing protein, partial [Amylostereum chailletii]
IPRPPNPWIIFRSDFLARNPIVHQFENDHRQLSRIIADTWAEMDDAAKLPFRLLAKEAKEEHRRKHPNYRFKPTSR